MARYDGLTPCGGKSTLRSYSSPLLISVAHDPSVSIHGPNVGHEHTPAAPAVPLGVLHGDGIRLVGRAAARAARHGA